MAYLPWQDQPASLYPEATRWGAQQGAQLAQAMRQPVHWPSTTASPALPGPNMAALPLPTAPPSSVPPGSALAAVANQLAPRGLSQATTQQTPMMPQSPAMPGRTAGAPLPMPDFMAANPNYAAQTQQYQQQRLLGEQGYRPLSPGADILRQAANGATTYQQPGVTGLGGISPGSATFQGLPQGGRLGYTGTPETAGMSQQEATAYNVANLNRQTDAFRSLNEARGMYGQGGGDNRAFGDLVSIGRAGESFGDDAMRAESAKRLVSQATGSSWVQNNRQRQGMLESAGILMGMNQLDTSPRRQAPNPLAMTDYQRGQLGLSRDQLAIDTLTQQNQNDLALKRFGLDQGIAQSTQALGRDRFSLDQSNALANQALKRDELGVEREKNQASLAAAMSKANPYQQTLVQEQAKTDIERSKANEEMRRHAADYFEKSRRLREIAPNTGLVNSGLASAGALFNSDRAAEKERFDALSAGMVLSAIKQLGTNPSNTDLKFVQKAVLDYGKTPEGNLQILNDMDAFMLGKLRAAGIDTNEFTQKPAATSSSAVSMDAVNQRGAALAAQGMSDAEIDATLRKEFALNGR